LLISNVTTDLWFFASKTTVNYLGVAASMKPLNDLNKDYKDLIAEVGQCPLSTPVSTPKSSTNQILPRPDPGNT